MCHVHYSLILTHCAQLVGVPVEISARRRWVGWSFGGGRQCLSSWAAFPGWTGSGPYWKWQRSGWQQAVPVPVPAPVPARQGEENGPAAMTRRLADPHIFVCLHGLEWSRGAFEGRPMRASLTSPVQSRSARSVPTTVPAPVVSRNGFLFVAIRMLLLLLLSLSLLLVLFDFIIISYSTHT